MTLEPLSRRVVVSYVLKYTVRAYPGICTTANANLLPLQETRSLKASKVFRGSQAQREIYVKRVPLSPSSVILRLQMDAIREGVKM